MCPTHDKDFMLKCTCRQELVLPSSCSMHPGADDVFVKLLYSLQNCVMYLKKKNFFFLPLQFYEKSHSKLSKNEPENIP